MQKLLLLLCLATSGCAAVTVEVERACSESVLELAPIDPLDSNSAQVATSNADFAFLRVKDSELAITGATTTLHFAPDDLARISQVDATIALPGEAPTRVLHLAVSKAASASGTLDLSQAMDEAKVMEKVARGTVRFEYFVSGALAGRTLKATARTCVATQSRWEKRAF